MKDPFEQTPPAKQKNKCPMCGGYLASPTATSCQCGATFNKPVVEGPFEHASPFKKNKPNGFNVLLESKKDILEAKKKDKEVPRVKDEFVSEEFEQCTGKPTSVKRKNNQFDDSIDNVWKSCRDLEIDG